VTPKETRWLRQIERIVRAKIEPKRLPTIADVAERRREAMKEQILESLKQEDGYTSYLETIDDLASDHDVAEVAAAILKLYAEETGRGKPEEKEDDLATFSAARSGRGESGMTRLFVNAGRNQSIRPQDIVGAIANEANIPGKSIGAIDILDTYTFVDVPTEFVDRVIPALQRSGVKGRPVNVEIANPEAGPPSRSSNRGGGGPRFNRDRDRDRGPRGGSRRFDRNRDQGRDHSGPPRFRVRRGE
jgi:ATP-dependent RNA helicase DeaD